MDDIARAAVITEIQNLYTKIAQASDYGTLEEYAELLADDVVWDLEQLPAALLPSQIRRGKEEVLAGARERRADGIQGPGTGVWHVLLSIAVEPGEHEATSRAYFATFFEHDKQPRIRATGVYHDTFVRTPDRGWVLSYRKSRPA